MSEKGYTQMKATALPEKIILGMESYNMTDVMICDLYTKGRWNRLKLPMVEKRDSDGLNTEWNALLEYDDQVNVAQLSKLQLALRKVRDGSNLDKLM